jgi:Holliday junction resolvase
MATNKKLGNDFEREFCKILAEDGFWTHNMAQNQAGQPADVLAVRNGKAYLIDCKVCSGKGFSTSRIEENQTLAMSEWYTRGNGVAWFAIKFRDSDEVYMIPHLRFVFDKRTVYSENDLIKLCADSKGYLLKDWMKL